MRIIEVQIHNYRCIRDLALSVDDYTVMVGPNGSGKSCVLYALEWFFNGGSLSADDLYCTSCEPTDLECDTPTTIDVEVSFSHLSVEDKRVLEKYGRGDVARFRRSWSSADGSVKMVGNSSQGPGFAEVRLLTRVTEMRPLYRALRERFPSLVDVSSKDDILAEAEPAGRVIRPILAYSRKGGMPRLPTCSDSTARTPSPGGSLRSDTCSS